HKIYGPTGIGILYGKKELLEEMPPYQGGGDMIDHVTFTKTTYNQLPIKFEAGTPIISEAIGLGAAIKYMQEIGLETIAAYEHALLVYCLEQMRKIPGIIIYGEPKNRAALISFNIEGVHHLDLGTMLDIQGIA